MGSRKREPYVRQLKACCTYLYLGQTDALRKHPTTNVVCDSPLVSERKRSEPPAASASTQLHYATAESLVSNDSTSSPRAVVLATAMVTISASNGRSHRVRALLDQGIGATFVSQHVARRLRAKRHVSAVEISGIRQG
ncbi:hypothetical protein KM043_012374 [Ampulex compressa]|nr:hypothetical protein KM043_012374 [Ampulex compressa]